MFVSSYGLPNLVCTDEECNLLKTHCNRLPDDHIFNDNDRRIQYFLNFSKLDGKVRRKLELLNTFLRSGFPFCEPTDWVCLASLPGCERQSQHTDFDAGLIRRATNDGINVAAFPYSCLAAINDGAKLYISSDKREKAISYNRGDVIIFRGDIVHAGTESVEGHFGRIHVYLDSANVKHTKNGTHLTSCHTDEIRVPLSKRLRNK